MRSTRRRARRRRRVRRSETSGRATRSVARWASGKRKTAWASPASHRSSGSDVPAAVERRACEARRVGWQQHRRAAVDGDRSVDEFDALDDSQTLRVVRADGEGKRERQIRRVLELDHSELFGVLHGVHPLHGVTAGHAHRGLHDGRGVDQTLAHADFPGREVPAVVGAHPPVERPAVEPRRHQPARIDDRLPRRPHVPDHRPVAVCQIGQSGQVAARHERCRARVELALEPERPHPVGPELRRGPRA